MVEGSGFLQWLSVYALALNDDLDVLLLDEPGAHLHSTLQAHLVEELGQLARDNSKQCLLATHSTTILGEARIDSIFRMEERSYLDDEGGRVRLFSGLGSRFAPRIDHLKRYELLFLYEGVSDLDILKSWAATLNIPWPDNLVWWSCTNDRIERESIFKTFKTEIDGLKALSLQDRDDYPFTNTNADLTFDSLQPFKNGLGLRRWRRRNIENYLLCPAAIGRAASISEQEVRSLLSNYHALNITDDFIVSQCADALANVNGKDVVTKNKRSIEATFNIGYLDIAKAMEADEIPEDPKTLLHEIANFCQ